MSKTNNSDLHSSQLAIVLALHAELVHVQCHDIGNYLRENFFASAISIIKTLVESKNHLQLATIIAIIDRLQ